MENLSKLEKMTVVSELIWVIDGIYASTSRNSVNLRMYLGTELDIASSNRNQEFVYIPEYRLEISGVQTRYNTKELENLVTIIKDQIKTHNDKYLESQLVTLFKDIPF